MKKNSISAEAYGNKNLPSAPKVNRNTPTPNVSMGANIDVKTSGIKVRGTGAATKGKMARGPMA